MDTKRFIEICLYAGYDTRSYSGRGMYGQNCVGFVTDDSAMYAASCIMQMADNVNERDELMGIFERSKSDNMGFSTVYYFPTLEWQYEDDEGYGDGHDA